MVRFRFAAAAAFLMFSLAADFGFFELIILHRHQADSRFGKIGRQPMLPFLRRICPRECVPSLRE